MSKQIISPNRPITIYWCDFCGSEFATFAKFPDDILPYCVNCSNDEDILLVGIANIVYKTALNT